MGRSETHGIPNRYARALEESYSIQILVLIEHVLQTRDDAVVEHLTARLSRANDLELLTGSSENGSKHEAACLSEYTHLPVFSVVMNLIWFLLFAGPLLGYRFWGREE